MNPLRTINLLLLVVLGVIFGLSKIMQIPQEMALFQGVMGFSTILIVIFAVTQLVVSSHIRVRR